MKENTNLGKGKEIIPLAVPLLYPTKVHVYPLDVTSDTSDRTNMHPSYAHLPASL